VVVAVGLTTWLPPLADRL
jgi:hypothetical protein